MGKYFTIFRLAVVYTLKNPKALVGLSIFLVTCLIIFAHLWKIAAAKTGAVHLHPDQLLWYIAFNEWVIVSLPDVQDDMEQDLRSGRLSYLLPRPISYLAATFAEAFGILCVNLLVLGLVTFSFTWIRIGDIPFALSAFPCTLLIGLLAGVVGLIFRMVIGLCAFWLQTADPIFWIWEKLLFTLGGLILPLAVYPAWVQQIAHLTPFPAILGQRSALAIDFNLHQVASVTSNLLLWGAIGITALVLLYRRGLRILNIEGG